MERERAQDLLTAERQRLQGILERHRAELEGSEPRSVELSGADQHQADAAGETYDREDLLGRIARAEADLEAVARAERRLAEGTYGVSVESGEPIPDERLERLPAAELTAEEARLGRDAPAPVGSEPDDDTTPLDEPAERPADLGAIPLSRDHDPAPDPQEADDEVRLPMPGEAYPGEGGAPDVGRPEPDDPVVDRRYRPER